MVFRVTNLAHRLNFVRGLRAAGLLSVVLLAAPAIGHAGTEQSIGMGSWSLGSLSNGSTDGRSIVKRNGKIRFRTHGQGAGAQTSSNRMPRVTVRIGSQCSQTSTPVRADARGAP